MAKILDDKRYYILYTYVGDSTGLLRWFLIRYWTWRINIMPEGEVLSRYYLLIGGAR